MLLPRCSSARLLEEKSLCRSRGNDGWPFKSKTVRDNSVAADYWKGQMKERR